VGISNGLLATFHNDAADAEICRSIRRQLAVVLTEVSQWPLGVLIVARAAAPKNLQRKRPLTRFAALAWWTTTHCEQEVSAGLRKPTKAVALRSEHLERARVPKVW